ncbi:zinc-dependent alcohol dehydrogenase family protein [Halobellus ruber]|uniref:Zinc-dependent alcohol dehydrogenase family protein n=1 Tax=Halobellus ruber TaxID=2761102 RepID=A0A7J9SHT9_9EURY|nr:zinc-dependent alcohol dehydrogenase family protein [Halobellus ruber]
MRVASLTDVGEMEVRDRERPEPGPNDVVVRVGACGVCATDLHMFRGSFAVDFPAVLGHESAGTIVEVGDDVDGLASGDRVTVNPVVPCYACSYCKRGETNLCENAASIGGAGDRILDGSFAEYVQAPAGNVELIGDLPFRYAALAEPLACCIHAADRSGVGQGDSVAVIGAGPIGLLLLQTLRNRGASPIAVSELNPKRREVAKGMGADLVVDPEAGDPVETISEEIGEVDAGIEVVGLVPTIQQAYDVTANGGTTLIVGVPKQDATMEINPFDVYYNDLDIRGTFALTHETFERAVTLLQHGRIDAEPLVTEEIGLGEIPSAFERMQNNDGLKKVVVPGKND